ncbi:hypothetical protein GCM10007886_46030 [Methylobacterium gregans]|nr:hypothetical protein GCM10007886_46030 [Methylobacterium gregans]
MDRRDSTAVHHDLRGDMPTAAIQEAPATSPLSQSESGASKHVRARRVENTLRLWAFPNQHGHQSLSEAAVAYQFIGKAKEP